MKITFITASPDMKEFVRIKEECGKADFEYNLIDFKDFKYINKDGVFRFAPDIPDSDIVVLRALFPTMASIEPLADYLKSRGMKVFDNGLLRHRYSMNKSYDIFKLILANIKVPDTFSARNYRDLYEAPNEFGMPLVVKSSRAGQGSCVWMVKNNTEYKDFIAKFEQEKYPAKNILVQGFVDYKFDLRIFVLGNTMHCMRRIPRSGDFRANFSLGGTVELFPLTDELRGLAKKAVVAVGLDIAGVDVLIDKEVNHTPGMLGMEEATHENITRMYIDYAIAHAKKLE